MTFVKNVVANLYSFSSMSKRTMLCEVCRAARQRQLFRLGFKIKAKKCSDTKFHYLFLFACLMQLVND